MPLWLDMLKTPMAAPETPQLKRMRFIVMGMYLACAVSVFYLSPLAAKLGRVVPIGIGILLIATTICSFAYIKRKLKADLAFLDSIKDEWLAPDGEEQP